MDGFVWLLLLKRSGFCVNKVDVHVPLHIKKKRNSFASRKLLVYIVKHMRTNHSENHHLPSNTPLRYSLRESRSISSSCSPVGTATNTVSMEFLNRFTSSV